MKRKKTSHDLVGCFLQPKVNVVHIGRCGTSPPQTALCRLQFQTESAQNDDAVRSAAADRIAIAHQNKPTVKEHHSYESNH